MSLEETVRAIVKDEISKRQPDDLIPLDTFCREKNISRVSMWRNEKKGKVILTRIGKRVFVNQNQFAL